MFLFKRKSTSKFDQAQAGLDRGDRALELATAPVNAGAQEVERADEPLAGFPAGEQVGQHCRGAPAHIGRSRIR